MRMMIFFDLPTGTKAERKAAHDFREFLLKDGYYIAVFGLCTHLQRLRCR